MADWTLDYKDRDDSAWEFVYLDPKRLAFARRGDVVRLTIEEDRSYLKVRAVRAFPLSVLTDYVGLLDAVSGREIGMIRSLHDLDCQARQLVEQELEKRYFIPKVARITEANKEFGTVYWGVDTDRGSRKFVMRGIRDSIHEIEAGRYFITDVDGNRFEIPQIGDLDSRSQALWDRIV